MGVDEGGGVYTGAGGVYTGVEDVYTGVEDVYTGVEDVYTGGGVCTCGILVVGGYDGGADVGVSEV